MSSLDVSDLATIINGILLAQKRGTYSLDESAKLAEPVKAITTIVNSLNEEKETPNEAETQTTPSVSTIEEVDENNSD